MLGPSCRACRENKESKKQGGDGRGSYSKTCIYYKASLKISIMGISLSTAQFYRISVLIYTTNHKNFSKAGAAAEPSLTTHCFCRLCFLDMSSGSGNRPRLSIYPLNAIVDRAKVRIPPWAITLECITFWEVVKCLYACCRRKI